MTLLIKLKIGFVAFIVSSLSIKVALIFFNLSF